MHATSRIETQQTGSMFPKSGFNEYSDCRAALELPHYPCILYAGNQEVIGADARSKSNRRLTMLLSEAELSLPKPLADIYCLRKVHRVSLHGPGSLVQNVLYESGNASLLNTSQLLPITVICPTKTAIFSQSQGLIQRTSHSNRQAHLPQSSAPAYLP